VDNARQCGNQAVSSSLATDSSTSAKHTTLGGRPISAGALTVQEDIFHRFSQLLQEDITSNIALTPRLPFLSVLISQLNVHNFCNWCSTLNMYIYINKNLNVRLFKILNIRKFFTDCFEILTQRYIRICPCFLQGEMWHSAQRAEVSEEICMFQPGRCQATGTWLISTETNNEELLIARQRFHNHGYIDGNNWSQRL
jgi:hypothetical protein